MTVHDFLSREDANIEYGKAIRAIRGADGCKVCNAINNKENERINGHHDGYCYFFLSWRKGG